MYQLSVRERSHGRWQSVPETRRGRPLFHTDLTHQQLDELIAGGAIVKATPLTPNFTWSDFRALYGAAAIVLFAVDANKRLKVCTSQSSFQPAQGDRVVAIVPPACDEPATSRGAPDDQAGAVHDA